MPPRDLAAPEGGEAPVPSAASKSAPDRLFLALCALVFAAGVTAPGTPLLNATILAGYEIAFVVLYVVTLRRTGPRRAPAGAEAGPLVRAAFATWFAAVAISLYASPLGLAGMAPAQLRFAQTIAHIAFFFAVRDFLARYRPPVHWLLLMIPAATVAVALWAGVLLVQLDGVDSAAAYRWFNDPPINSHIRHSGYQAAAGASALLVFFAAGRRGPVRWPLLLPALVTICTFLFWMGGRGAIVSVAAALVLLAVILAVKRVPSRGLWAAVALSVAMGFPLAEWFAVFHWNGLLDLMGRTVGAGGDLNRLASMRLDIWASVWESVKDHLLFGLGPQGYWFMPNRIYGIQPHNFLLQFLLEWGLIGGLLFSGLLLYGFYRGAVAHVLDGAGRIDLAALSAGSVIVALTVHGLTDGTYYHPQPSLYLALAFAVWTLPRRPGAG